MSKQLIRLKEQTFFMCKKCGFKFGSSYAEDKCNECGGEFFTIPYKQYEEELEAELDTIYRHDVLTNTLTCINNLPKLEEILDNHNIPHQFDAVAVLKVIQKQDKMCAGIAELRRKREKRRRANGIPAGASIFCPYCSSGNVRKIGFTERLMDFSGKTIGNQWHCMNCGSDF